MASSAKKLQSKLFSSQSSNAIPGGGPSIDPGLTINIPKPPSKLPIAEQTLPKGKTATPPLLLLQLLSQQQLRKTRVLIDKSSLNALVPTTRASSDTGYFKTARRTVTGNVGGHISVNVNGPPCARITPVMAMHGPISPMPMHVLVLIDGVKMVLRAYLTITSGFALLSPSGTG
ncbi:hypothetical protein FRC02_006868 [Tulasnella sp. 418]|nr:hypothetical protein FRC02_006868 [Tulasnella sp. 418]